MNTRIISRNTHSQKLRSVSVLKNDSIRQAWGLTLHLKSYIFTKLIWFLNNWKPGGVTQWIACSLHMWEVLGLPPPPQPGQSELTPQVTSSAGDGASTLALKLMGGVNRSPKQRAPMVPQNGDLSPQKIK